MQSDPRRPNIPTPNLPEEPTSSRDRAARVGERDYFRRRSRLDRWKLGLTLFAAFVTVAWLAGSLLSPDQGVMLYTHGEVCSSHAAWEANCEACHEPYHPINENSWYVDWFGNEPVEDRWKNTRCQACHAGPMHHDTIVASSLHTCGSCHRDHNGRDFSLVDLPDHDCTRCHANIDQHHTEGSSRYVNITDFGEIDGHPEFALLDPDRSDWQPSNRTLKFSHSLHMTQGLVYDTRSRRPWTLGDIPRGQRDRYGFGEQDPNTPVQLNCASCHVLDGTDVNIPGPPLGLPDSSVRPPRGDGKYFLPITYEVHCQACHPLNSFDGEHPEWSVPHRLQPPQIEQELRELYAEDLLTSNLGLMRMPLEFHQPSDRLDGVPDIVREQITVRNRIEDKVWTAKVLLFEGGRTCQKCHDYAWQSPSDQFPIAVKGASIPSVWFEHAVFDHTSHRAMDCMECHAGAVSNVLPSGAVEVIEKEPLKLPGIDNCRQCHAPAGSETVNGKMPQTFRQGGVAHNCTECHRYHHGDRPLHGRGSSAWNPTDRLSVGGMLQGTR